MSLEKQEIGENIAYSDLTHCQIDENLSKGIEFEKFVNGRLNKDNFTKKSISEKKKNRVKSKKNLYTNLGSENLINLKPKTGLQSLSLDLLRWCFEYLTEIEILRQLLTCKLFYNFITNSPGIFRQCKDLVLDSKWGSMPIQKRQKFLSQMENLEFLYVYAESFCGNGLIIQEVAALVYKNHKSLKILKLLSPDNPLKDDTPRHEPFSFMPVIFPQLKQIQVCGCQALEWFHILGNCDTPSIVKLEVSHFSLPADHWSWNVLYDFTSLGVPGLHRLIDTMGNLEKLTVGFDVWFESATDPPPEEARSLRSTSNRGIRSFLNNLASRNTTIRNLNLNSSHYTSTAIDEINFPDVAELQAIEVAWNERGIFRSYKGKLCEEDFGDIFTISLLRTGHSGSLKRINLKYRIAEENDFQDEEGINPISEFFRGTSSFCQRLISDVIKSFASNVF